MRVGDHGQKNMHTDLTSCGTRNPLNESTLLCLKTIRS